ncbi:MAG TPA: nuclear transport factor 2 family protein, partial [Acidimicrobiales bacterium]|nr:nuclear transport factor 2 family protein [Acidimicrobiales bacterium]
MADAEIDVAATVRALDARVRHLEDTLALYELIASYGPAADSGSGARAAALFTEDGTYDAQVGEWTGRADIAAMFDADMHRGLMNGGCGHVLSLPRVVIDGDR